MLDVARLIAAIGVIAAHVIDEFFPGNPAWILGSYAVPFYLFVAIYFTVRGFATRPERAVGPYIVGRFKKLYVPFLLWNVLYDVLHVAYHPDDGFTPPWQMAWAAVYTHLYFLPFLFVVTVLLCLVIRPLLRNVRLMLAAIVALTALAIVIAVLPQPTSLDNTGDIVRETLWNFHRALPAACLGIAFALLTATTPWPLRTRPGVAIAGVLLTGGCLTIEYFFGQQGLLRAGSGFGLALFAFMRVSARWLAPLAALGRLSFGVYLAHVAVIRVVMVFVHQRGLSHDPMTALTVGTIALVGGLAVSAALASSSWTRRMIGCESNERSSKPREQALTPALSQ